MYKLLIVDDNKVQLNYITDCVDYEKLGIKEIRTACDGEEGIEIYNEFMPDIIITDVEMPVIDGVEMMKKLIAAGCSSKFIFVSCYGDFDYIKEAMDNNAVSYILKPVEPDELEKSLKKVIVSIETEKNYSDIKNMLEEFCDKISQKQEMKIENGISESENMFSDIKLLIERVTSAYYKKTHSFEYDDGRNDFDGEYKIDELKESIIYMLENTAEDPVNEFLQKYYDSSKSIEYIRKLSVSVVTTLQLILVERGININELYGSSAIVWDKIDHFETIPDTHRWLYNILNTALEFINTNEHGRYKKIINDIMENINENYASVSNVNEIIGDLYISASYAQSIFKKYTGKTISDYVIDKRMEAAKLLLADPYIKVYEVAEKVGYKSKAHFTEIFKKYTGLTPKEFRATH